MSGGGSTQSGNGTHHHCALPGRGRWWCVRPTSITSYPPPARCSHPSGQGSQRAAARLPTGSQNSTPKNRLDRRHFRLSSVVSALHPLQSATCGTTAQAALWFETHVVTLWSPKRSPLSEITSLASSTAVFSRLPIPKRMPISSALDRAAGPSESNRSLGRSSGGSCFMVYLRRSTTGILIPTHPEALQHPYRQRERQADDVRVIADDPFHKRPRQALDGIPTGFADAFAQPHVGFDLCFL